MLVAKALEAFKPTREGRERILEALRERGLSGAYWLFPPCEIRMHDVHVDDVGGNDKDIGREFVMDRLSMLAVWNKLNKSELALLLQATHDNVPILVDIDWVDGECSSE